MKKLYWRPTRISLRLLWVVAFVAVIGLIAAENYTVQEKQPYYAEKIKASKLAQDAFNAIKAERLRLNLPSDPESDPAKSGLIGELLTPVTTNPGHLPAKQTSANPNFAAVIVQLLKRAPVEEGDVVAVGLSGSFPAINVTVLSALATLKLEPIIISSGGSSQWGANLPSFMWPDMERLLFEKRFFPYRSVAISRGGIDDRGLGLTKFGRKAIDDAIVRSGVPYLEVKDYTDSVERRMALYRMHAGDKEIKAYINVGGGTTSVGTKVGKSAFKPGINREAPKGATEIDSIMTRFVEEGVPVVHLTRIDELAMRFGLPTQPQVMPLVGQGKIFFREVHSTLVVTFVLVLILLLLVAFVRLDWGYRILTTGRREAASGRPERMV
ncbi:MAG: poly-gamma-glutamate system protein [Myxococcales bacterium]|nr:MAG: poly-gamma-glutamate system protein [Myxococcales bacterium]